MDNGNENALAPLAFAKGGPDALQLAHERVTARLSYQVRSNRYADLSQAALDEIAGWWEALCSEACDVAFSDASWQVVIARGDAAFPTGFAAADAAPYARSALASKPREAEAEREWVGAGTLDLDRLWRMFANIADACGLVDSYLPSHNVLSLSEEAADLPALAFFACLAASTDAEGRAKNEFPFHVEPARRGIVGEQPAALELRCACARIGDGLSRVLSALRAGASGE
jgi:hypothetical protein